MKTKRHSYLTVSMALIGLAWTGAAETSNPLLDAAELPSSILEECYARDVCEIDEEYVIHWLDKTPQGNAFLVMPATCGSVDQCTGWLVEKTAQVSILLTMEGRYRLVKGKQGYPNVHVKKPLGEGRISYSRFEWRQDRYVKISTKELYTIDGKECGTSDECHQAALREAQHENPEQALKIWETVHRISWI